MLSDLYRYRDLHKIRFCGGFYNAPVTALCRLRLGRLVLALVRALQAPQCQVLSLVVVLFIGGLDEQTIPRQMWNGIREQISPAILSVATILVIISTLLLATVELLRRRSEKLRGITPH